MNLFATTTGCINLAKYKVSVFGKIPSTQTFAHDLIARGAATDHSAIVASAQSAGRGRYRRTWVSHHGNLYVSFIFKCTARDGRLAYRVAVAVADTLRAFGVPAQIKWPNDIMVDSRKICGILIEYNQDFVVVGIGVNIKSNPRVNAAYKTTRLDRYCNASSMDVLGGIMKNLDRWMHASFATVRLRWMGLAMGLNDTIMYQGAPAQFHGIASDGAMILMRDGAEIRCFGDEITI